MKFVICILVAVFATTSFATKFDFKGTVACKDQDKKWCYTVEAKEVDMISDDTISSVQKCYDPNNREPESSDPAKELGKDHGDFALNGDMDNDGILDNYFEIALQITHNCTGKEEYIEDDYEEVHITKPNYSMKKSFNLNTNKVIPEHVDIPKN